MANNNNNNVIFETDSKVVVTKESFTNRANGEVIEYNSYKLVIGGEEFKFKFDVGDRKLFEFIAGIGRR